MGITVCSLVRKKNWLHFSMSDTLEIVETKGSKGLQIAL